jgi:sulfur carrier protein
VPALPAEFSETKAIEIVLNGEPKRVPEGLSVLRLLHELGVDPERVAVELNRAIVRRPDWQERMVEGGASVEIVQFVGGG